MKNKFLISAYMVLFNVELFAENLAIQAKSISLDKQTIFNFRR